MINSCNFLPGARFYVAIDNKGLWPNVKILPDSSIGAAIYNSPSHGYGAGSNMELWTADEDGHNWKFRSLIGSLPDESPEAIRMNHAFGINRNGELISLISGYQKDRKMPYLPLQLCISKDNGISWERSFLKHNLIPFGDIVEHPCGELLCSMYDKKGNDGEKRERTAYLFSSSDAGRNWNVKSEIGPAGEIHLLYCSNGELLAAARSVCSDYMDRALPHGSGTVLYRSSDMGKTWDGGKLISPQGQENANLVELSPGKIACFITSRIPGLFGVVYRISSDYGKSWSNFNTLISIAANDWRKTDCGYPSCVRLKNKELLIAYYFGPKKPEFPAHAAPWHQHYHMGVCICGEDCLLNNI